MYDRPHLRYSNHSQKRRLKPLNQNFHDGDPTCKQDFLDFQYLSIFMKPSFDCQDFSASPLLMFSFVTSFKTMAWRRYVKCGRSHLMFWIKMELRRWRQWIEPPNWSTNVRSKGGRGYPQLTKSHQQKKSIIMQNSLLKDSFKLLSLFLITKIVNKFFVLNYNQTFVLLLMLRSSIHFN